MIFYYVDLWKLEEGFIQWIYDVNMFCNSLVDCIVLGFFVDSIGEIIVELGYQDELIVVGEQYYLWVIEGLDWIGEELFFVVVGFYIKIVSDLIFYRIKKVRILNGVYMVMMLVVLLYGLKIVWDVVEYLEVGQFIREMISDDIFFVLKMERFF